MYVVSSSFCFFSYWSASRKAVSSLGQFIQLLLPSHGVILAWWKNPLTGETSESLSGKPLEEARVDFGKAVGQFLCFKPALKAQLVEDGELMMRRLYVQYTFYGTFL